MNKPWPWPQFHCGVKKGEMSVISAGKGVGRTMNKAEQLESVVGEDIMTLAERATFDSVATGICMNEGCDYTTEVEPDASEGHCEECRTPTVMSCLVLLGII
jgi:hypothetical protein